ncbi:hypothetical protein [Limnoglobus roseus]|uniref:DUF420 domain-containing protein n=1 Tax=Limnoglobus roseus TaxID=2598579 RepID=A0A5C1A6A5_9BACT|nr:hypothetical protein [Limnoglobus roseus]QEL13747.1 hypothetical protein PX52LOC_00605 [Limnoglobus roseus]
MLTGPQIILTLKVLVAAVTVLFVGSLVALAADRKRLHGRINWVFFLLTMTTVFGFELLLRLGHDVTSQFTEDAKQALRIHLCFSIPSAVFLPVMLFTGTRRFRRLHLALGWMFCALWAGTFVTGIFFLPHE